MKNIACLLIAVYAGVFTAEIFASSWSCTRCVFPPFESKKPLPYQFKEEMEFLKLRRPATLLDPKRLTYDFSQSQNLVFHDVTVKNIFTNTRGPMKEVLAALKPDGVDEEVHAEAAFLAYVLSLKMAFTHAFDLQRIWVRTMSTSSNVRKLIERFSAAAGGHESSNWIINVLNEEEELFEKDVSGLEIDSTVKNLVLDVSWHIKATWNATLFKATKAQPGNLPVSINDRNQDELKSFLTALSEERVLYWYYNNLPLQEGYRMLYEKLHENSDLRESIAERRKQFINACHENVIIESITFAMNPNEE